MTTFKLFRKAITSVPWHFWFSRWWWQYLSEKSRNDTPTCGKIHRFWCRAAGHPDGPIYYNVNGLEPNWKCKECGDDLE